MLLPTMEESVENIVFKIYDKTSGNLIEERFASTENLKNNGLFTRK